MASVKRARFTKEPLQLLENIKDAPQFVMPSIRTVCKILSTPAPRMTLWSRPPISRTLPPHIFAGVSSILHFISKMTDKEIDELDEDASEFVNIIRNPDEEEGEDYKEVVLALIVAVYFLVLARRRSLPPNTPATSKQPTATASDNPPMSPATESRKMDKKTFSEMRQTALSSLGLPAAEKRHGEDVDAWIEMIQTLKWAKGQEWFDNIPLAGEREDEFGNGLYDDDDEVDGDGHGGKAHNTKRRKTNIFLHAGKDEEGLLLPGLGTMMQDRVDYLSEDRKEDFLEWKADMLERIGKIMKTGKRMVV